MGLPRSLPVSPTHALCCLSSTILEEEKVQQEERMRMESRRQVAVSWDSGGSDEAPPKVAKPPSHIWPRWGSLWGFKVRAAAGCGGRVLTAFVSNLLHFGAALLFLICISPWATGLEEVLTPHPAPTPMIRPKQLPALGRFLSAGCQGPYRWSSQG